MPSAPPPGFERASPMPNAKTRVTTRAARPTRSVQGQSLKRQTFRVLSDAARAATGRFARLPEAHPRRLAQARAPLAPAHEARFARLAQVQGLDLPRRGAKSA